MEIGEQMCSSICASPNSSPSRGVGWNILKKRLENGSLVFAFSITVSTFLTAALSSKSRSWKHPCRLRLPASDSEIGATILMHCFGQGIQFPSPYSTEERSGDGIWSGERKGGSTAVERTLKSRFDGRYRDGCSLSLQNAATFSAFSTSVFCNSRFRFERAHCESPLINQNWHFND